MKIINLKFFVFGAALLLMPTLVLADTVLRTGEFVTVSDDQVVENDFYAAGGSITMSGLVREDMYAIGGSVTQNGAVDADLGVIGGSIQIHAPVGDDLRAVGGEIVIADDVKGDVFVIGGVLQILSSAEVSGDVFFYGGEATIAGPVGGSIMGTSEKLRIDSSVEGTVDVMTGNLTLGDRASVGGDVSYESPREVTRSQSSVVEGEVVRNDSQGKQVGGSSSWLTPLLIWTFATLALYLFFRREIAKLITLVKGETTKVGVIGLIGILVIPVLCLILIVTVLGALIGLIGLFSLLALYLVAATLTSIVIGSYVEKWIRRREELSLFTVLIGQLSLLVLWLIPVIGQFVVFVAFVITFGSLLFAAYRRVR